MVEMRGIELLTSLRSFQLYKAIISVSKQKLYLNQI